MRGTEAENFKTYKDTVRNFLPIATKQIELFLLF